uniref:Uncharacterized protein n=1 Tax=Panagrolaimus sp. JU765 TaxID=591449 RepID=A0AC34R5S3_9BILA
MLYAATEVFLFFNFKFYGPKDGINQFVIDKWPSKGRELLEMSRKSYEMYLTYLIAKILYSTAMTLIIGQEITRFRVMRYVESRRQMLLRRRDWEHDQQYRVFMREAFLENPHRELYQFDHGLPPPPHYDVLNTARIIHRNTNTPPPSYSMIERIGMENNESNSPKDTADVSQLSTDASTAMSPSSFLHSPYR